MANILMARESFVCKVNGMDETIRAGDLLEADHPAVKKNPGAFVEPKVRFAKAAPVVEQATAAPGEKRVLAQKKGR